MEAVVKQENRQASPVRHPTDFKNRLWFKEKCMFIKAPEQEISNCRSTGPTGEKIEGSCDYVVASRSLQGKIKNMERVEDFEFRPQKAVIFLVAGDEEIQEVRQF